MNHIESHIDHNNKLCQISFGTPFKFDGPLIGLANIKDGKRVVVVGLSPHTVDLTIDIPFEKYPQAIHITYCYHDNEARMIEKLNELKRHRKA